MTQPRGARLERRGNGPSVLAARFAGTLFFPFEQRCAFCEYNILSLYNLLYNIQKHWLYGTRGKWKQESLCCPPAVLLGVVRSGPPGMLIFKHFRLQRACVSIYLQRGMSKVLPFFPSKFRLQDVLGCQNTLKKISLQRTPWDQNLQNFRLRRAYRLGKLCRGTL